MKIARHLAAVLVIWQIMITPCPAGELSPVLYWEILNQDIYAPPWFNLKGMTWREVREQRKIRFSAFETPKRLRLRFLPEGGEPSGPDDLPDLSMEQISSAVIVTRDPCGVLKQKQWRPDHEKIVTVPSDKMISGRYILAAHLTMARENIHLYPKQFVIQYKKEIPEGDKPDVFITDADLVPFEIGPVITNPRSKHSGGIQFPNRPYQMIVKYKNQPLPGARVTVFVEGGGWHKNMVTDERGIFIITPTDDRSLKNSGQNYIYLARHVDEKDNSRHVATLTVHIYKNAPEWTSKAMGFGFWTVLGCLFIAVLTAGVVRGKKRRDQYSLTVFNKHRINGK